MGTAVLTSIEQVAGIGRGAVESVRGVATGIQSVTGEVESAVGEIAQNVSDQGVILTLLPTQQEQRVRDAGARVREAVASIVSAYNALQDLLDAIDRIPFVDAPRLDPEKAANLASTAESLQNELEQYAASIQQFRDNAAGSVSRVSDAAGAVTTRLDTTVSNLNEVDSNLADIQTSAQTLTENLVTIVTITAIVITLFLVWTIYGMVLLTQNHWRILHPPARQAEVTAVAAATKADAPVFMPEIDDLAIDVDADASAEGGGE